MNDSDFGAVHVSHESDPPKFRYEPFFVARAAELPHYDERVVGYGYTRNTQERIQIYYSVYSIW